MYSRDLTNLMPLKRKSREQEADILCLGKSRHNRHWCALPPSWHSEANVAWPSGRLASVMTPTRKPAHGNGLAESI